MPDTPPQDIADDEQANAETNPDYQLSGDEVDDLRDFVTKRFGFGATYESTVQANRVQVRQFLEDFYDVMNGASSFVQLLEREGISGLSLGARNALNLLQSDEVFANELIREYVRLSFDGESDSDYYYRQGELRGYRVLDLIRVYQQKLGEEAAQGANVDPFDYIKSQLNQVGNGFEPYFTHIDTQSRLSEFINNRPGKFRQDTPPPAIARWQCRIGAATFLVPPTNINVSQSFYSGSITGGAIRQPNSPKTNLGHSDTNITMSLIFPNHESIWGFKGDKKNLDIFNWDPNPVVREDIPDVLGNKQVPGVDVPDSVIDYYLSSLRGLITQFKYSPILPVKNEYLNRTFGITAVTMNNMSISTVEGYPFVMMVTLEMSKFNYQPFLPMIQDFDQAIHWGKFRQYLGRAAAWLDDRVNEGFLVEVEVPKLSIPEAINDIERGVPYEPEYKTINLPGVSTFDKLQDLYDGKNFNFYYPKTTPSRIYAPDTTDFRQPGEDNIITEDIWDGVLSSIGLDIIKAPRFNFFEYSNAAKRVSSENNLLNNWLRINSVIWNNMNDGQRDKFIEEQIANGRRDGSINDSNESLRRRQFNDQWYFTFFDFLLNSDKEIERAKRDLEDSGNYIIKEWEVPMERLAVDWSRVIVQGVQVGMSNNFARMQLQLQEGPTFQYIGGGDSSVSASFIVLGEDNLIKFKRMFEHINGLARLEQAHGVLGFLGIKNVITALCGIKYVLPNSFEIDTVPNMPHVYRVGMTFVDFDVMQQKREELSSEAQKMLVDTFGKRNPFLRTKQMWNFFNGYPDLPLSVKDERGTVLGYMDPDWYFRSFMTRDEDIINWQLDDRVMSLLKEFGEIKKNLESYKDTMPPVELGIALANVEKELRDIYQNSGGELLPGFKIENGSVKPAGDISNPQTVGNAEMRQYLGVYGEDNETAAFIDFFKGGYFMLGTENTKTNQSQYVLGMSAFREDLASTNTQGVPSITNTTPLAQYQKEYIDGHSSPQRQFESMMQDFNYRDLKGRMIKAFPTYMLWLIDEGGKFAGIKLFDNFYSLNSVIDFSVVQSEDAIDDTLVLRLSNMYQKLTTPYRESLLAEDDPLFETPIGKWITTAENRQRNLVQGLYNEVLELNHIRLKPGVRLHLRVGYGSNPNALQTVFNGTITEVQQGDIMTVIAQTDAVELTAMVNSTDAKGSSGKLDGGINTGFWMSEPRDLIVRLLTMGSSYFKEWMSWGTKGVIFSESKYGIRHFGSILYEPMNDEEVRSKNNVYGAVLYAATDSRDSGSANGSEFAGLLGESASELSALDKMTELPSLFSGNMVRLAQMMWVNSFTNRDYELFKRNIYPGNGTGIGQYMGGDMIDAGVLMGQLTAVYEDVGQGTTTAGNSSTSGTARGGDPLNPQSFIETFTRQINQAIEQINDERRVGNNQQIVPEVWRSYQTMTGVTDEELAALLAEPLLTAQDLSTMREKHEGLLESLIGNGLEWGLRGLTAPLTGGLSLISDNPGDALQSIINPLDNGLAGLVLDPLRGMLKDATAGIPVAGTIIGGAVEVAEFLSDFRKPLGAVKRMAASPVGRALGFVSYANDDDLEGYDEVSFRAQTYMKTVWDLFKVCAALLPNYIVAVRPFEDRSTVFYGKPHWLYTSGVIPVSSGLPKDLTTRPRIEQPNQVLQELISQASKSTDMDKLNQILEDTDALKDIMHFSAADSIDPFDVGAGDYVNPEVETVIAEWKTRITNPDETIQNIVLEIFEDPSLDFSGLTTEEMEDIYDSWTDRSGYNKNDYDPEDLQEEWLKNFQDAISDKREEIQDRRREYGGDGSRLLQEWLVEDRGNADEVDQQLASFLDGEQSINNFAINDPVTFAWQFGWKFSAVPVWIDPHTGFGQDIVGNLARQKYDQGYSASVDARDGGSSIEDATDIWRDFRSNDFRGQTELRDAFVRLFPNLEAPDQAPRGGVGGGGGGGSSGSAGGGTTTSVADPELFNQTLDAFMRFMWQDPYNRAWVVIVVDRIGDGLFDTLNPFGDNSKKWSWDLVNRAWEIFLSNPITFDDAGVPQSGATRNWMQANEKQGKRAGNIFTGVGEDVGDWVGENIGQIIGLINDTLTGFIASIRLSLAQMGSALSQSGEMQKQANILNAAFNDSIYYRQGNPGDLVRLIDNPFTREYGEPVIEIREPFQRIHYISSFDAILSNGIMENLNDVPTVVTAVSDGKNPVKVHFDKGIPPDRQVEKIVETGLYWDNAMGSGLFGMLQPLLHPFETARAYSKAMLGSSDQLSSRRIALAHLKEGLKDIYQGEILIIGDPDIRPFDLLYIADVYERMYGMVEVEQVTHHFTPDMGFVTAIVPNAIVTVNDPSRWTMLSYVWSKMNNYNLRNDVRTMMAVQADRNLASATKEIKQEDVYQNFSTQLNGSMQYTQGNSGLVKDIAASFSGGGIDEQWNQVAKADIIIGGMKPGLSLVGAGVGTLVAPGIGSAVGGFAGFAIGDLLWEGWQWVKENLLDQHGCYIQFLSKDGQPMDAGLSYYSGVAVGSNHTVELFPNILGLTSPTQYVRENGHYRITTNDLLGAIGWSETETTSLYRETSLYVNQINKEILHLANRSQTPVNESDVHVIVGELLIPSGQEFNDRVINGVVDGDTINVRIMESNAPGYEAGSVKTVRLASINTFELQYKNNPYTTYNETLNNDPNDMAVLAYNYLVNRFKTGDRTVAIRFNKRDFLDDYGRTVGVVFHNAPLGTQPSQKGQVLKEIAGRTPLLPWDAFLEDGRPYTLNWEMVMSGYGNVDMRESLWDTNWRDQAVFQLGD